MVLRGRSEGGPRVALIIIRPSPSNECMRMCLGHGATGRTCQQKRRMPCWAGEAESWDFGVGAGFYVNATTELWRNWRMYEYVTEELPALLAAGFPSVWHGALCPPPAGSVF